MVNDPEFSELIARAERSLAAYLVMAPDSKHKQLSQFYTEIRGGIRRDRYPTARDLFWDAPESVEEKQCLNDALAVFRFVGK